MIQNLIDYKIQQRQKDHRSSGKISPSGLGSCFRKQIYGMKSTPVTNPPDARGLRIFECGRLFHEFVQQFLPRGKTEVLVETKMIKGFVDYVSDDTVYDLKSQRSDAFWYMENVNYDVKKEKYNNWLQVACYAMLLKRSKMSLVFISKDDLCIKEYTQDYEDWKEELKKELFLISQWKMSIELPAAKPRLYNGKECQYCNWRTKCEVDNYMNKEEVK